MGDLLSDWFGWGSDADAVFKENVAGFRNVAAANYAAGKITRDQYENELRQIDNLEQTGSFDAIIGNSGVLGLGETPTQTFLTEAENNAMRLADTVENGLARSAGIVGKTIGGVISWQLWLILGGAALLFVFVYAGGLKGGAK